MLSDALRFATVVVIDDMAPNLRLLESSLKAFGLRQVHAFSNSGEGLEWLQRNHWDLLLLDLDMPAPNGFEILQQLAGRDRNAAPVIIVTALSGVEDRRRGLELGANDYILKNTPPAVVAARLRAQLRQHQPAASPVAAANGTPAQRLVFGKLVIDEPCREVTLDGERIALSTSDFDLLWQLASHAGEVQDRDTLLRVMRGLSYDGLDRSIDIAVSRLRKKLGDDPVAPHRIKTVRNKGYLFSPAGW